MRVYSCIEVNASRKWGGLNGRRKGHWLLVIGYWSLVIGHWSLVIGHWSLVIGYWSLVIGQRCGRSLTGCGRSLTGSGRSLTEPLGRPKVSLIAGDLRSAVSAGSETLAERGHGAWGTRSLRSVHRPTPLALGDWGRMVCQFRREKEPVFRRDWEPGDGARTRADFARAFSSGVRSKRHGIPLPFLRKRTYRSSCRMGGQQERPCVFPRPFRLSATMRNGSRFPGILVPFFAVRRMRYVRCCTRVHAPLLYPL